MTGLFRFLSVASFLTFSNFMIFGSALAAPQALGLVATYGDIQLNCGAEGCSADFTTFCLQQDRTSPERGTPYHVGSGEIEVAGLTATGERVQLNPQQSLSLESRRKHMALRMFVAKSTLKQHNLVSVSISVKDNVVLLPKLVAGETNPHSRTEIASLSHSLRQIGSSYVDGDPDRTVAARVLGDVINGLPERGKADPSTREKLWKSAVGRAGSDAPAQGVSRAKGIYQLCKWMAGRGTPNMRHCLETHHDKFIKYLNSKYWKGSRPIF